MALADINALINSIPAHKELLKNSFEELQSCAASSTYFTIQWKDIDDHISSIVNSIGDRFQKLKSLYPNFEPEKHQDEPCTTDPFQYLKSLCINMDSNALRSYIIKSRMDNRVLVPPLLFAPDPVALVFNLLEGLSPMEQTGGQAHAVRRTCFAILESVHQMNLDIKVLHRERARRFVVECKGFSRPRQMENDVVAQLALQMIVMFGLFEFFKLHEVLDFLVVVAGRKKAVNICMNSVLREMVPDLIEKLISMGKPIYSLKFVVAFNLVAKYPPGHLIHSYVMESKGRLKHNMIIFDSKRAAIKREIVALEKVIKTVEECNLHHAYNLLSIHEQIRELQKLLAETPQPSRSKEPNFNNSRKMWRQQAKTWKKQQQMSNF